MNAPHYKNDETFYDILKVHRKATIAEIVAAYHTAKNAFSKDSVATYSLFGPEENQLILDRLEEAYLTLSNIEKKRDYDSVLLLKSQAGDVPPTMTELELKQNAHLLPKEDGSEGFSQDDSFSDNFATEETVPAKEARDVDSTPIPLRAGETITGTLLKDIREKRALTVDDVARITKIPTKFIRAIESEDMLGLPARVYLQGFVKNLATLYRLDPALAVRSYLEFLDQRSPQTSAG